MKYHLICISQHNISRGGKLNKKYYICVHVQPVKVDCDVIKGVVPDLP